MSATPKSTTTLELCRVAPPVEGGVAAEQILPLTFFDMVWLHFHPIQRLLFYQLPCSKTHFLQKIVPSFKKSLSQTLKHFLPLAGNLIYPVSSQTLPELRYVPGDSVSVTVSESSKAHDFDYLTGNHPRVSDEFYAFFPDLPPAETEPDWGFQKIALLTVQITLFPGAGICIGINNHHIAGDASSIVGFIKAWSSIAKFEGDREFLAKSDSIPIYDRSLVTDPSGLANIFWNRMKHFKIDSPPPPNFPINRVRATYVLQKHEIQKLRSFIQANNPFLVHLSSFTITTAYVWACLAKSAGDEVSTNNEAEYFGFAVDARQRTSPPVPAAYFGNCVGLVLTETTHSQLKGEKGFLIAVELIGEVISTYVNNKEIFLSNAEEYWSSIIERVIGKRLFGVAGSPKFDLYDSDFGWGKPNKFEAVSIDGDGSMSLCKSREFDGALEIGLSMTKKNMDAFALIFSDGLKI